MLKTFCIILSFRFLVASDYGTSADLLQSISKRLDNLESKLRQQAYNNADLRKTVTDVQEENQQLKNQINVLQARDQAHENEIDDLQKQVKVLVARDQERSNEIKELLTYTTQLTRKDGPAIQKDDNKDDIKQLEKQITERSSRQSVRHIYRRENELNVAFFSALGNHLHHLGASQNVVFDRVITNLGNAYNNHAGDFRAPVAGTYVFSVTLMAYSTHTTHYNLVQNGTTVANIYVRGLESPYASSSMTAVLQLKQGEDVAIRNVDTDQSLHGSYYSTFSGFLLNQDYSSSAIVGK
ncbi:uncharacterized protein LOC123532568 [Mercenaria mercenaria]|uniref:uncharacterized protein LOC123532568 n=1 Tax=Mercenaria mercenaria TaxID=6596 RepID=UPI00234E58F1|nr:uncharacterized protein LOC123532568 [Mercenaria mercenaria]